MRQVGNIDHFPGSQGVGTVDGNTHKIGFYPLSDDIRKIVQAMRQGKCNVQILPHQGLVDHGPVVLKHACIDCGIFRPEFPYRLW